jgi:hypothetical protein
MKISNQEKMIQLSRSLLIAFLILIIYDGALRKWIFLSSEKFIFIIKDIFIIFSFITALLIQCNEKFASYSRLIFIPLIIYAGYVIFEIFNPLLPNILVGLWGAKSHLLYACLVFILPVVVTDIDTIFNWLKKVFSWIVIPVCLIAIFQSFATPESILNSLVRGGSYYVSPLGDGFVRSTATFSYISGFAWFLQATLLVGFHLLVIERKISYKLLIPLILLIFSVPTNGSRSVVMIVSVSIIIMIISYVYTRIIDFKSAMKYVVSLLVLSLISVLFFYEIWGGLIDRFLNSYGTPGDSARYYSAFTNAFKFFGISGWFGFGVGSANNAAPFLVHDIEPYAWLPAHIGGIGFEEESGRLVVELGVVGWLVSIFLRGFFCLVAIYLIVKAKTMAIKAAVIFTFPTLLLGLYLGSGVFFPPVGAAFYWFCVAILLIAWNENKRFTA